MGNTRRWRSSLSSPGTKDAEIKNIKKKGDNSKEFERLLLYFLQRPV
jgi:hypothetical protein